MLNFAEIFFLQILALTLVELNHWMNTEGWLNTDLWLLSPNTFESVTHSRLPISMTYRWHSQDLFMLTKLASCIFPLKLIFVTFSDGFYMFIYVYCMLIFAVVFWCTDVGALYMRCSALSRCSSIGDINLSNRGAQTSKASTNASVYVSMLNSWNISKIYVTGIQVHNECGS